MYLYIQDIYYILHPSNSWDHGGALVCSSVILEKLGTRLEPQSCSPSLWMTSPRHQSQIFLQSGRMQIAASECCSNEKSPGRPEGCICGFVTPENPVARETIFAKRVVWHAAALLLCRGIGSKSVLGESLYVKLTDLIIRPGFPGSYPLILGAGKITSRAFLIEFWDFFLLNVKACRNKISLFEEINRTNQNC